MKRKVIERLMQAGLFPYTPRYLGTLPRQLSPMS
jgi:hypothetical protein